MGAEREHAVVTISGAADHIRTIVKQLAWLTATLKVPRGEMLTVSCIDFQSQRTQTGQIVEGLFRMSLWHPKTVPRPNDEPGQCWTRLFRRSVLAYGFPSSAADRPEGMQGLEVAFDIMASFAGVRFPVLLGERLAFAGDVNVLIPEKFSENSVQWHFDTIKNARRHIKTSYSKEVPGIKDDDLRSIDRFRAFLGYSSFSEVLMGTQNFKITQSETSHAGGRWALENKTNLSIGIDVKKVVRVNAGITLIYKKGETAQIDDANLHPDKVWVRSSETPALFYDDKKCTAFLLNELSIAVQMVATYLKKDSTLGPDKIPYASRSFDGGQAALAAVRAAENLDIPFRTGQPRKYSAIVREFIDLLVQRKTQSLLNEDSPEFSLQNGLRGWGFSDLQEQRWRFHERHFQTTPLGPGPIWWQLFRDQGYIVLFGRSVSQPIQRCHQKIGSTCDSWDSIPEGHHLLLANVVDLNRLTRDVGGARTSYPSLYMLSANLAWARPQNSRLFTDSCKEGRSCNPLQTMRAPSELEWKEKRTRWSCWGLKIWSTAPEFLQHPGHLEPPAEGSVLFADNPGVIAARKCRIVEHRRDATESGQASSLA